MIGCQWGQFPFYRRRAVRPLFLQVRRAPNPGPVAGIQLSHD